MSGLLREYVFATGYARWNALEQRSETFEECLHRLASMHIRRFPHLKAEIQWAIAQVRAGLALPAMRSLQYAGAAIERNHVRIYNTWGTHINRPEVFGEALFVLLSGGGIGFSVQRHHVAALPAVVPVQRETGYLVEDSIEGWSRAFDQMVQGRFQGVRVHLDTHRIRAGGSLCACSGNYAPGPRPLQELERRTHELFDSAEGRTLRPIECYDLLCFAAEAASADHNGRSAMLALFSPDDEEMIAAKSGNWYATHPWRRRSNNSAVLLRNRADRALYERLFDICQEWGDPGVYWTDDPETCSNSCVEAGFYPVLTLDREHLDILPDARPGERRSGWQGCSLSEINGAALEGLQDFKRAARAAALLNTLQAAYTDIDAMLGPVSRWLCERDALIGVGITGMADNPRVAFNPRYLREAAHEVLMTNADIARRIGIRPAKRTTLIKPAGKTSLLLGGTSPGIHPRHAERYLMRFVPRKYHPAHHAFKRRFPELAVGHEENERMVFAVHAPDDALTAQQVSATEMLELVKLTLLNWVSVGQRDTRDPVSHNVSNTVSVKDEEWTAVKEFIWRHQGILSGVALMAYWGDGKHPNAPLQKLSSAEDQALWQRLHEVERRVQDPYQQPARTAATAVG
ncbi:MAG TPA: hypothetical protein VNN09_06980 [Candidatus Competibacteraceae bacterium]|nr:hypothetical protein [Candidatus Competibacteraceae bacterium]